MGKEKSEQTKENKKNKRTTKKGQKKELINRPLKGEFPVTVRR